MKSAFKASLLCVAVSSILAGCGGGGTTSSSSAGGGSTVTASPYILFASDYLAYPTTGSPNYASTQSDGTYLTSAQWGDVFTGFGGHYQYGGFSSDQHDMNFMGGYRLQITDNGTAPTTANDYSYIAFTAPGTHGTSYGSVDISQATNLVIRMGNTYRPTYTASVFTVSLSDGRGSTAATNNCSYDQTLNNGSSTGQSQNGFFSYVIPLSSFTCTSGTMAALQPGLTTVAVKVIGSKNTSVAVGNYQIISVGHIGFTAAQPSGLLNSSTPSTLYGL
jgi:hypothetical protein